MDKINNFSNGTELETGEIKTDISHIYSLIKNNQNTDDNNPPATSGGLSEYERKKAIEKKADSIRYVTYFDYKYKKMDMIDALKYKSNSGIIKLPTIMFFHYATDSNTRESTYTNNFHVDFVASCEEDQTDDIVVTISTNNDNTAISYEDYNFKIESTGTICSFDFAYTNVHFKEGKIGCPIFINIRSKNYKEIKCYVLKIQTQNYMDLGNFSATPIHLVRALPVETLDAVDMPELTDENLPVVTSMFMLSDTVGFTKKIKIRDFYDTQTASKNYEKDIFDLKSIPPTTELDSISEITLPGVACKNVTIGRGGEMDLKFGGANCKIIDIFYLTPEGHVYYKVYDIVEKRYYEGQFCEGVYEHIAYFSDGKTNLTKQKPCFLFLVPIANTKKADKNERQIQVINFDNDFYKQENKDNFYFQTFAFKSLGLENHDIVYLSQVYAKDYGISCNFEVFDGKTFQRKNFYTTFTYNTSTSIFNAYKYTIDICTGLPGCEQNSNNYYILSLDASGFLVVAVRWSSSSQYTEKRLGTKKAQDLNYHQIFQPIYTKTVMACDIDEEKQTYVVKFKSAPELPTAYT